MPKKKSTVMDRIEPNLKRRAEEVLHNLGIPVSVVITSLYRQIALTGEVPFPLIERPRSIYDLTDEDILEAAREADYEVKHGLTIPAEQVFAELREKSKRR